MQNPTKSKTECAQTVSSSWLRLQGLSLFLLLSLNFPFTASAASFVQTDWSAGVPADATACGNAGGTWTGGECIATDSANQAGWQSYKSADANLAPVNAGADLAITATLGSATHTTDADFSLDAPSIVHTSDADFSGTTSSTTVSGGSIQLAGTVNIDSGTGADGAYSCASGTCSLASGTYNYTTFDIASGATVNVTGTVPLVIKATGDVNIAGTLNLNGGNGGNYNAGSAGTAGPGGGAGGGSCQSGVSGDGSGRPGNGGGKAPANGSSSNHDGAGGGGYGATGGSGGIGYEGSPGAGGGTYGDAAITNLYGGAGGGGAATMSSGCIGAKGGGGGGAVQISAGGNLTVSGLISAKGGKGGSNTNTGNGMGGGGGGGSGGAIKLVANAITLSGSGTRLSATGGTGGAGCNSSAGCYNPGGVGGDGGDGRIRLEDSDGTIGGSGAASPAASVSTISTQIFNPSGTYTSPVIDTADLPAWGTVTWTEGGTGTVSVKVRSCNDAVCAGETPFSSLSAITNGQDISTVTGVNDGDQYIQYEVTLSTADASLTPTFDDITINYTAAAGASGTSVVVLNNSVSLSGAAGPTEISASESGLVALYHMNNNWSDASGNGNNGTAYYGTAFTTAAKLGSHAGSYDGVNDYVGVADSATLQFGTGSFTIEAWLKPAAFTSTDWSGGVRWFSKSKFCSNWQTTPSCNWFVTQITSTGLVTFGGRGYGDPTNFSVTAATGSELPLNLWSHVAIVVDRDVSPAKGYIYVNGQEVSSGGIELPDLNGNLNMAGAAAQVGAFWAEYSGSMDEFAIYNRTLSASEIRIHSNGPYNTSGTYTSSSINLGNDYALTTLDYTVTTPAGTGVVVDVRAGNTAVPDASWTGWLTSVANGGDISSLGNKQYVQYRATLSTTDTSVTPSLDDITFNYNTYATGSYDLVSSIFDTGDAYNKIASLSWNADTPGSGSDVKFQLRTSTDGTTWGSWSGPTGSGDYYTTPGTAINAVHADGDDRYFQYKATLTTTDDAYTPLLQDVTVAYETYLSTVTITATDATAYEQGADTAAFTVARSGGDINTDLVVYYSIAGTAANGADYSVLSGGVTIPSGSASAIITVTPLDDALVEGVEDVILTLSADAAYLIGSSNSAVVSIASDDAAGVVVSAAAGLTTTETGGSAAFSIVLSSQPTADVSIALSSSDSTEGSVSPASVTFTSSNWNNARTITLTGVDDDVQDGDISYQIIIGAAVSADGKYNGIDPADVSVINVDDDAPVEGPQAPVDEPPVEGPPQESGADEPRVEFALDQVVEEGHAVTVKVYLDAQAASYPLSIPYTVGGSADGQDHDAADGAVVIDSGLVGELTFNVFDDGISENDETVVFTLGDLDGLLAGARKTHTVTITERNVAPAVELTAVQGGVKRRIIALDQGVVTLTANVTDANSADQHTYDWSGTDNALVDMGGDDDPSTFIFDPAGLLPGFYEVSVVIGDDGVPALSTRDELLLQVIDHAPVLTDDDSDGDGVPDSAEGLTDNDMDGIPDYVDSDIHPPHELQGLPLHHEADLLRVHPGLGLRLGDTAFAAGDHAAAVQGSDIGDYGGGKGQPGLGAADDVENVGGYFDFEIVGLPIAGQSAQIVIPQLAAIPPGAVYRKYRPDLGWGDFVEDDRNSLASAPGISAGVCPLPGDSAYVAGLVEGYDCIQLTLEDGGPNDADGVVNGVIKDPGGVGVAPVTTIVISSAGGTGALSCWSLALLCLLVIARCVRRAPFPAAACLLVVLLPAGGAEAAHMSGWYAGAALGYLKIQAGSADLEEELAAQGHTAEVDLDNTKNAWRIYAGHRFGRRLAIELGYLDLAALDSAISVQGAGSQELLQDVSRSHPHTASGWTLSAETALYAGKYVSIAARAGIFVWETDVNVNVPGVGIARINDNGIGELAGLGMVYPVNHVWQTRLMMERIRAGGEWIDLLSLGIQRGF